MRKSAYFCLAILVMVLLIYGCRTFSSAVDNYTACKNDAACSAAMYHYGNMSAVAVTKAVETLPVTPAVTFAGIIGQGVGYVVSALAGVLLGKKLPRNL